MGIKYCWFLLRSLKCSVQFVSPTMLWGSTPMTISTRKIWKFEIQFTSPPKLKISQITSLHSFSKSEYLVIWENLGVPQFYSNVISLVLFCCGFFMSKKTCTNYSSQTRTKGSDASWKNDQEPPPEVNVNLITIISEIRSTKA